jgi:hypothetical protein
MLLPALLLGAWTACPALAAERPPEEKLRSLLVAVQRRHIKETKEVVLGAGDELKDAVAKENGHAKKAMLKRLPGMAADPLDLCRDVNRCHEAPLSTHVDDHSLINDAFLAMARPWFVLQKARGKGVAVAVEAGLGVQLRLDGLPGLAAVTFQAEPVPSGGFDIVLQEGPQASQAYAQARAVRLASK